MKQLIRFFLIAVLISSVTLAAKGQGVYSLTPQPVCWSYNGTDSSLLSLVVFDIRDTIGLFQGYVNAVDGSYVNTSAGGTVSAGYCCCGSGSGGTSNVTITDNDDGTYTAIVGTDTTIIYTKADSLYTTQTIQIADTSYLANSVVQDVLIAISNEVNNLRNETGCDLTITQASHGFTVGDLLTQDPNTAVYSAAAADTSINFPVAYVCSVIDANNFKVDTEGWVSGAHGETDYRDYFLQDTAGDVDTTSGSFPIFAFRTFTSTLRYYDIPEYVSAGTSGGGSGDDWGSQVVVTDATLTGDGTAGDPLSVDLDLVTVGDSIAASNGLHVDRYAAGGRVVSDVRIGGTLDENTTIDGDAGAYDFLVLNTEDVTIEAEDRMNIYGNNFSQLGINTSETTTVVGDTLFLLPGSFIQMRAPDSLNFEAVNVRFVAGTSGQIISTFGGTNTGPKLSALEWDDNQMSISNYNSGGTLLNSFTVHKDYFQITGAPNYANDAAADADGTLPSGGVYTVTAEDRTLRIKP